MEILEAPERRINLDPDRFWDRVGLSEGERVADVGAGTGYFAVPAARRVGPTGVVHAVDVSKELMGWLAERALREGLTNLTPHVIRPGQVDLPDGSVDVLLFANVLHDLSPDAIRDAARLVRPGGRLLNLDWRKEERTPGPPMGIRLSPEQARDLIVPLGFRAESAFEPGPWHYAQSYRRVAPAP